MPIYELHAEYSMTAQGGKKLTQSLAVSQPMDFPDDTTALLEFALKKAEIINNQQTFIRGVAYVVYKLNLGQRSPIESI